MRAKWPLCYFRSTRTVFSKYNLLINALGLAGTVSVQLPFARLLVVYVCVVVREGVDSARFVKFP